MTVFATGWLKITPVKDRSRDPRFRWRCDGCGRFAAARTSSITGGYWTDTPDQHEWNDAECFCVKCK